MGVYLTDVHLMRVSHRRDFTGVYLTGVHLTGVHHMMQTFYLGRTYVFAAFGGRWPDVAKWQLGTRPYYSWYQAARKPRP
jgi:hypothetical protein